MKQGLFLLGAFVITGPGLYLRLGGLHVAAQYEAFVFGLAVLGAAFLLAWAAEVAQVEVSQALAIAVLALIAVLPEYAVDMYFAWSAAAQPAYGAYATANMTGANRLLIGLGWPLIILLFWLKSQRQGLPVEPEHRLELSFMAVATLYAFFIPWKGTLSVIDTIVLFSLFGLYMRRLVQAHVVEPELVGPAELVGRLSRFPRRVATVFLFLFSGTVIFLSAEPFAEALIATGAALGIDQFFLVQWLAPLASEAPEFVIAGLFVLRGFPMVGLHALISSKVNQWTLLVGGIPLVYSIAGGTPSTLMLDARQVQEVLLTAAQSLFAVTVMMNMRFSLGDAIALFALFAIQLFWPETHNVISVIYLLGAAWLLWRDRIYVAPLAKATVASKDH